MSNRLSAKLGSAMLAIFLTVIPLTGCGTQSKESVQVDNTKSEDEYWEISTAEPTEENETEQPKETSYLIKGDNSKIEDYRPPNSTEESHVTFIDDNNPYSEVDYMTLDEVLPAVKECMRNRDTEFSFNVEPLDNDKQDILEIIYEYVILPSDVPDEGDYIYMNINNIGLEKTEYSYNGTTIYAEYNFTVSYYTTYSEEEWAGRRITEILDALNVWDMGEYDKIAAIYAWLADNVAYDYDHLDDQSYMAKYSAYAALHDGTAVCQGYASLMYRMLLTAGVRCRCIDGIGENGAHVWNIVQLDGIWYECDVTWDSGLPASEYRYFLKGTDTFYINHTPSEAYTTEVFMTEYPISAVDYVRTD